MNKRVLDHDAEAGVTTYHAYDDATDTTYIETVQNVAPFLERNRRLRNDPDYKRRGIKNEWMHFASIPISVQYQWLKEFGVDTLNRDHWPKVKRLLQDPEWSYLRTTTGGL